MENLSGKQLGPYRIVAPLGEGGMASVYKAFQPSMDRHVALKILPRHFSADPQFVARFRQEARVIAKLQHVHILPVHDFGESDDYPYIVMPLLETGTLEEEQESGKVDLERTALIAAQVGSALEYAHAHDVIHRDVKPANILVDHSGNCLLTDFGIAKMVSSDQQITRTGALIGTPAYMSPEQIEGLELDGRSDQYSLGIVLYELVVGRVPFRAETPAAVFVKHLHDPLPTPRTFEPGVPKQVEVVITKALSKDRIKRFDSMSAFVSAYREAVAESKGTQVKPARQTRKARAESQRPIEPALTLGAEQEPPKRKSPAQEARNDEAQPARRSFGRALFIIPVLAVVAIVAAAARLSPNLLSVNRAVLASPSATRAVAAAIPETETATVEPSITPTFTQMPPTATSTPVQVNPANFELLATSERLYPSFMSDAALNRDSSEIVIGLSGGTLLDDIYDVYEDGTFTEAESTRPPPVQLGVAILAADTLELRRTILLDESTMVVAWGDDEIWAGMYNGNLHRVALSDGSYETILELGRFGIRDLAVSPDGELLAIAKREPGEISILNITDGNRPEFSKRVGVQVHSIAWSPDGQKLAITAGSAIWVLDRANFQDVVELTGHENWIVDLGWSADGQWIATASSDGTIGVWDLNLEERLYLLYPANGNQLSVAFSPDQRYVASGSSRDEITIWDLQSSQQVTTLGDVWAPYGLMWAADGRLLSKSAASGVTVGGTINAWGTPD